MSWLLSYLYNALWQIPVVLTATWLAARMARAAGPAAMHRVWVAGLLGSAVLPACSLPMGSIRSAMLGLLGLHESTGSAGIRIILDPGASAASAFQIPPALRVATLVAWAGSILWFAIRLTHGLLQTHRLARNAEAAVLTPENASRFASLSASCGVQPAPRVAVSTQVTGPVTVGLLRPCILLPPHVQETIAAGDFDAVMAHELAHIARRDFTKNLLYRALMLPVAWHPCAWQLRARVSESRELACDESAAAAVAGRRQYARSLLRLAMLYGCAGHRPAAALGIFDVTTSNALERRVMTLNRNRRPLSAARQAILAAACFVLAIGTGSSALALHMNVDDVSAAAAAKADKPLNVSASEMTTLKISGDNPTYPAEAKKKKIQGKVVLNAHIGTDGAIHDLRVVKSSSKLLSDSAIEAVRTWKYRPYLLNGNPVPVDTTINVIYNLAG